jgi:hypothetical protein
MERPAVIHFANDKRFGLVDIDHRGLEQNSTAGRYAEHSALTYSLSFGLLSAASL